MGHIIKIAHEAPKSVFELVQGMTDYDYALVHLFEEDEEYYKLFQDALAKGREVILDNSIFELGEAFSASEFVKWIEKLRPTYYIVPDVLEDCAGTIRNMKHWNENYRQSTPGKVIGVVQGKTYEEIVECYKFMVEVGVDRIAIPFDFSFYEKIFPHSNKLFSWWFGRLALLRIMLRDGVIDTTKEHHLLGCSIPGEGMFYPESWTWITSTDTSNPVLHGCVGIRYRGAMGLTTKSPVKMFTIMNQEVSEEERRLIEYNVKFFRRLWNSKSKKLQ